MTQIFQSFYLKTKDFHEVIEHAKTTLPEEACGLIGGRGNRADMIVPVENELHSPDAFRMDAIQQVNTLRLFEEKHIELVAIFHSHPKGPPHPSQKDIDEFYYPGVLSLIVTPEVQPAINVYYIENKIFFETKLITY